MAKKFLMILRLAATLFVWVAGGYVLNKYEYFMAFWDIDNIVGMIPVALVLTSASGATITIWIRHTKQRIPFSVSIALLIVLSVVLFPTALRGNWWINPVTSNESESKPDLSLYAPFSLDSKTAKLTGKSTLQFSDNLPVLDGATALYPIYAAFAETVYNEDVYTPNSVLCTNTKGAYEAIIKGERDIIFAAGASEQQIAVAKAVGADLHFTPIGREAFVFLGRKRQPYR